MDLKNRQSVLVLVQMTAKLLTRLSDAKILNMTGIISHALPTFILSEHATSKKSIKTKVITVASPKVNAV